MSTTSRLGAACARTVRTTLTVAVLATAALTGVAVTPGAVPAAHAAAAPADSRRAPAVTTTPPSLMLPWPAGQAHRISGDTYLCGGHGGSRDGYAIDFGLSYAPVAAAAAGLAHGVRDDGSGFGNYVWIEHGGGWVTLYGHLSALRVAPTQAVAQGQLIGISGSTGWSTGPHLHFRLTRWATYQFDGAGTLPEPMSGLTGFGHYGVTRDTGCRTFVPSPLYVARPTTTEPPALGAIGEYYYRLGGAGSLLGHPTSGEVVVPGGRVQHFTGGDVFWSPPTGAHEVHGAVLAHYRALGGAASVLGLPTTDQLPVVGGVVSVFSHGRLYSSAATGAHEVHGPVLDAYLAQGGARGDLGLPTTDQLSASTGVKGTFLRGRIYYSAATGAHAVRSPILDRYVALGASTSPLGLPLADAVADRDGTHQDFAGGTLAWSATTGSYSVRYR